ncbi:MAG: phospholipid-binding protein [Proteobacteria bacterium]|nr:MAG: phospholipid-binding protein [Pseudomonadota bacterium]
MRDPDAYLLAKLREALAGEMAELGLDVTVEGGRVRLAGVVGSEERRRRIEAIALAVLPEHEVTNDIGVQRLGAPASESLG